MGFRLFYNAADNYAKAFDKIAYVNGKVIDALEFAEITADAKSNWLDQSESDFEELLPLANRETKFAKTLDAERAVFKLNALGVNTARDEWVYDFDARNLREKALFFADTYNELLDHDNVSDDPIIKWSEATRNHFSSRASHRL